MKDSFKFTVEPGQTAEWSGKKTKVEYDDSNFAKFSHKYSGYIVIVENSKGKIIHTAGTNSLVKYAEQALKLKSGQTTTREFR